MTVDINFWQVLQVRGKTPGSVFYYQKNDESFFYLLYDMKIMIAFNRVRES